jgi:uncharacterized protein
MKSAPYHPEALRMEAFAADAAELKGCRDLREFERLQESAVAAGDAPAEPIAWQARGELRTVRRGPPQVWLHLQAQGHIDMECQRCLEPVRLPLGLAREFLFVADEAAAEALDAESDHDVLALSSKLDLFQLLEDELLLELPLIAMHEVCTTQWAAQESEVAEAGDETERTEHPFAALAGWKRRD